MNVSGMAMAGNRLMLKYSVDMEGTPISTVMTLTPDGRASRAEMAIMDGQYEMAGHGREAGAGRAAARAQAVSAAAAGADDERGDRLHAEAAVRRAHAGRRSARASCCRPATAWSSSPRTPT